MVRLLLALLFLASTAFGQLSITNLTSGGNATSGTSDVTASVSPTVGALICVWTHTSWSGAADPGENGTTITSSGFTTSGGWTTIDTSLITRGRITLNYAVVASGSGTITIDYNGASQTRKVWIVEEITGFDTGTPIPENAMTVVDSTVLASVPSGNLNYGASMGRAATAVAPESGETETDEDTSGGSQENRMSTQYVDGSVNNDWSFTGAGETQSLSVEVAVSGGAPTITRRRTVIH